MAKWRRNSLISLPRTPSLLGLGSPKTRNRGWIQPIRRRVILILILILILIFSLRYFTGIVVFSCGHSSSTSACILLVLQIVVAVDVDVHLKREEDSAYSYMP